MLNICIIAPAITGPIDEPIIHLLSSQAYHTKGMMLPMMQALYTFTSYLSIVGWLISYKEHEKYGYWHY